MGKATNTVILSRTISLYRNICQRRLRVPPFMIRGKMRGRMSYVNICDRYGEKNMATNNGITWVCKHFSALTTEELYRVLRLRSEVFVVEQNCVFLDMDNKDFVCDHLMGWREDQLVGYSRIVPPGIFYVESSIGR